MQEKKSTKCSKIKKVTIVGVIPSFPFQRAKYCALELHRKLPQKFPVPEIVGLLEFDWNEKLTEWRQTIGREYWCLRRSVAVFFDDRFIGSDIELIKLTSIGNILLEHVPRKNMSFIKDNFRRDYISYLKKMKRIYCYLDICVDEVYVGTLTFQLYSDLVPKTCENFKSLCLGNRGPLLSYKSSRIHRIVKHGWVQGGDIQYKTGGGGFSIFCDPLEDECFGISHDRRGILSMANGGRNENGSQFFITLQPSKWMDTHFVAFGRLVEGSKVLKKLENLETSYECPLSKIEIKSCGKLDLEDVEDVDARYAEARLPKKKAKKIETISEQIIRLIMQALTDALAKKEHAVDILDDGDVPSKMNLQLYFQGFYSISQKIVEETAQYMRNLRRQLYRVLKPSATEVVEVITYDLLMAVLTRMTTLDDVRETIGHELYQKMVGGIDMKLELCEKPYVKRLIDQIVATAESMVDIVNKKLLRMKRTSANLKRFQERMQNWVQSFVLQETFVGDYYHITKRPGWENIITSINPISEAEAKRRGKHVERKKTEIKKEAKPVSARQGTQCCEIEEKKRKEMEAEEIKKKFKPEDICCLGSKIFDVSEVRLSDYFKTCRYDLKKVKKKREPRMELIELIEVSRFNLKWMRKQETRTKSDEMVCLEKKIRKWMKEVVYTPETSWIKELVFENDDEVLDHIEEIMYGAMTVALIEMYYFMEQYLKKCGGKKHRLVTRVIYPEETLGRKEPSVKSGIGTGDEEEEEFLGEVKEEIKDKVGEKEGTFIRPPCTCGHPCCVCLFDPHYRPPSPDEGEEEMGEGEGEEEKGEGETDRDEGPPSTVEAEPGTEVKPCPSDMELVDLNAILAEKTSVKAEEIDIRSFKWLKKYILEEGCDLKTDFATQVHKWLEGEGFNYNGFISKHSLVTRASLLSLSISLTELIKEENKMKTEIKDFIYDLWELYFHEMEAEALLENPITDEDLISKKDAGSEDKEQMETVEDVTQDADKGFSYQYMDDECKKILAKTPDFDFDAFCSRFKEKYEPDQQDKEIEESKDEIQVSTYEISSPQEPEEQSKKLAESAEVITQEMPSSSKPEEAQSKKLSESAEVTTQETPSPSKPEEAQPEKLPEPETPKVDEEAKKVDSSKSALPPQKEAGTKSKKSVTSTHSSVERVETHDEAKETPRQSVTGAPSETVRDGGNEYGGNYNADYRNDNVVDGGGFVGSGDYGRKVENLEDSEQLKTKKSPIIIEELISESSGEESRHMPPYVLPFWVKFLTELTKQALGAMAKVSRLPRRLYFLSETDLNFDDKMKEWFEFNAFNPKPTKGREIMDYIALHHRSLTNLEDTARSYLKKKKYSGLINRCSRTTSAGVMADEIVADVIDTAMKENDAGEEIETLELFVSNLLSTAIASTSVKSESTYEDEENTFTTDQKGSYEFFKDLEVEEE